MAARRAPARPLYVMIEAIPDANQTFREITFDIVTQAGRERHPAAGLLRGLSGLGALRPRRAADRAAAGRTCSSPTPASRTPPSSILAARGRLVLNREKQPVELDPDRTAPGTRRASRGRPRPYRFPDDLIDGAEPGDRVRQDRAAARHHREDHRRAAQGRRGQAAQAGLSPHPEIMCIQQKFSIPVACLVFAMIGLALGPDRRARRQARRLRPRDRRDLRLLRRDVPGRGADQGALSGARGAGARVGQLPERQLARWGPNIVLGIFGIAALVWRARFAERRLPDRACPIGMPHLPARWSRSAAAGRAGAAGPRRTGRRRGGVGRRVPRAPAADPGPGPARPVRQPPLHPDRRAVVPGAPRPLLHLDVHRRVRQAVQGAGDHAAWCCSCSSTGRRSSSTT